MTGHKFIDAITAADIRELILPIEARGARDVAKRPHETIGQIFRYAIANGLATRNPAADFKRRAANPALVRHHGHRILRIPQRTRQYEAATVVRGM